MRLIRIQLVGMLVLFFSQIVFSQYNRINYNNQQLFLNGTNLAWLNFASDVGAGNSNFQTFADAFLQFHDNGGNAVRWWLHTDGAVTPEFDDSGYVISAGLNTISDIKNVLDLAWEREVGVILCLWSFDMMLNSKGETVLNRNSLLLNDTNYTKAYINNCLIPMVDSLKGHPAIIAWEIFNEPEGMTNLLQWSNVHKVPISSIQRFVNLCAGAIHRTDSNALVTNGSQRVAFITDISAPPLAKVSDILAKKSETEKREIEERFFQKYGFEQTAEQLLTPTPYFNYYSDSRLIAEGSDADGTLDFYQFHFYEDQDVSGNLSPFARSASAWNFDKPAIVGEFHMRITFGTPINDLYRLIYLNGYAGALAWSWTDNAVSSKANILAGIKYIWDNYRTDVDVLGIGGDFPLVSIISPISETQFPDNAEVTIEATASDSDGSIALVEFFANDTLKIGESISSPYSITWTNIEPGDYKLTAVATDNEGHQRTSSIVNIKVGTPPMTKLEAESANKLGSNISVKSDPTASGRNYVDVATSTGSITWTVNNYAEAGTYEIIFGFRLAYDSPKEQFINVNGVRIGKVRFEGQKNTWLEQSFTVDLIKGANTIQMEMEWGWIHLDYMSVPTILVTSVETIAGLPNSYSLQQNFPNPFNPSTTISYQIPKAGRASLKIYDVLGREVAILVDKEHSAGKYNVELNVSNSELSSGIYFYRLTAKGFSQTKKLMLLK